MGLFTKRPLACACILFVFAVLIFSLLSPRRALIGICIVALLLAVAIVLFFLLKRNFYAFLVLLLLIGFLAGGIRAFIVLKRNEVLTSRLGEEVTVLARVREVRSSRSYASSLEVEVLKVNDTDARARAIVTVPSAVPFYRGDCFIAVARVEPLSYDNYYEGQKNAYRATGSAAILVMEDTSKIKITEHGSSDLFSFFDNLRARLALSIRQKLPGKEGDLLAALLLGEDENLSERTERDFRRAGVSHVLAISGLHVGMLAGVLERILIGFGLGKRKRSVLILLLLAFYVALTGFSFSTIRSVLMLFIVYLAFFLNDESDGITSLCLVAALILLVTPHAVFSISYQMTALATFGILSFEGISKAIREKLKKKPLARPLSWLLSSLLITFSASFLILPIQWLNFGEISLMTPIANFLVVPFILPLLLCGLLLLFAIPTALFASLAGLLGKIVLSITAALSDFDGVISLTYDFVPFVIFPCFTLCVLLLLIDLKKRKALSFLPIPLFVVVFFISLLVHHSIQGENIEAIYTQRSKNEALVMASVSESLMIDISNGSLTSISTAWYEAKKLGVTELDTLLLTHYHNSYSVSLRRFTDRVKVRRVLLPTPITERDHEALRRILQTMEDADTTLDFYEYDAVLTVFKSGALTVEAPLYESRSVQPTVAFSFDCVMKSFRYESAVLSEYRREKELAAPAIEADYYLLGAHGPIPHEKIVPCHVGEGLLIIANEEIYDLLQKNNGDQYAFPSKIREDQEVVGFSFLFAP